MCLCFAVDLECLHISSTTEAIKLKACRKEESSVYCATTGCVCARVLLYGAVTVPVLAGLQLLQPQPCGERVAHVGVVPDCRQAHYLSLAKGGKK